MGAEPTVTVVVAAASAAADESSGAGAHAPCAGHATPAASNSARAWRTGVASAPPHAAHSVSAVAAAAVALFICR